MVEPAQIALYVAAAFVLAITPGPGLFYVTARTLAGGRAEGIASSIGTGLGGLVHVLAGSLGVSAVVLASAELFTALKWVGAAYLVWVGVRTIRQAHQDAGARLDGSVAAPPLGTSRAFREGIVIEALNPKTAAFFLAFIPQFVDLDGGHVAAQFIVLGSISVLLNTTVDIVAAVSASRVRHGAARNPELLRRLQQVSGGTMIALGVGLALVRRPAS